MALFRQREDIQLASHFGFRREILGRADKAAGAGDIARIELADENRAGPAADAGEYGDVLPAVGSAIRDGLADDSGVGSELPALFAGLGVDGAEAAVHRAVENQ